MTIEILLDWIDRELDGDLPPAETRTLHAFLDDHPDWRHYRESLMRLEHAARSAPLIHPSPGFTDRVMGRLAAEAVAPKGSSDASRTPFEKGGPSPSRPASTLLWIALSAALAAAAVFGGSWVLADPVGAYDQATSGIMGIVENAGVGIANALQDPGAALEGLLASGPAAEWALALAAVVLAIFVNILYARKAPHA